MKFPVGAVREPPLPVDFHGKGRGYILSMYPLDSKCKMPAGYSWEQG
jgi:hypothetical protein